METVIHLLQSTTFYVDYSDICPNFLDKKDSCFLQLHSTLDALFHQLHSEGIGVQTKHTEILTKKDDEKLWSSGVIGVTSLCKMQPSLLWGKI